MSYPHTQRRESQVFRDVGVACELRLISIDDVKELFKIAVLVHCHFENSSYCQPDHLAEDEFVRDHKYDTGSNYVPEIVFVNVVDSRWERDELTVRVNRHTGVIWATLKNIHDINESLELFSFPFDRQLFRVAFKSPNASLHAWDQPVDVLDLPPIMKDGQVVMENDSRFFVSCELNAWHMVDLRVVLDQSDPDAVSLTASEFELTIMAERNPLYYLNNYVLVLFVIVMLNVCNMALSIVDSVGERLAASLTLLLAGVAFKSVLSEMLPRVAYSTWADAYVRVAFLTLFFGSIESFVASPRIWCLSEYFSAGDPTAVLLSVDICIEKKQLAATQFDLIFQLVYGVWWILCNLIAAIICLHPTLVQQTWDTVLENQIGDTEATTRRTNEVKLIIDRDDVIST